MKKRTSSKTKDNQMQLRLPPEIKKWIGPWAKRHGFKSSQRAIVDILRDRKREDEIATVTSK